MRKFIKETFSCLRFHYFVEIISVTFPLDVSDRFDSDEELVFDVQLSWVLNESRLETSIEGSETSLWDFWLGWVATLKYLAVFFKGFYDMWLLFKASSSRNFEFSFEFVAHQIMNCMIAGLRQNRRIKKDIMLWKHSFHVKLTSHETGNSRRHASVLWQMVPTVWWCVSLIKPKKGSLGTI